MARKKTDVIQFKVRMLEDLRKRLDDAAVADRRSLNSEIVDRLERSFMRAPERVSERYRLMAEQCLKLAQTVKDSETKRIMLGLANSWLVLAAHDGKIESEEASRQKELAK